MDASDSHAVPAIRFASQAPDLHIECGALAEVLDAMHVDLARLVEQAGSLPVTAATDFAIQICERLAEIHDERGIRHEGRLQFGSGADVRSVGTVLYELLGGTRTVRPDLPLGLQAVVLRCLRTDPNGRIRDARRLAIALAPYASRSGQLRARHMQHPPGTIPSSALGTIRMVASVPLRWTPAPRPEREPGVSFLVWLACIGASLGIAAIGIAVISSTLHLLGY